MKDREVITVNTFTTIKYLHSETTSLAETSRHTGGCKNK